MRSGSPKGQRTPPPRELDVCCCAKQRCWGGSLCKPSAKENAANWEDKRGLAGPPKGIAFPHQEKEQDWRQLEPRLRETQEDMTALVRLTFQPFLLTFLLCI
ncbi:unnamed protein product [Rangifer tarandus platyrhynchus]|uniref:Uncharacterized protein n=1 Tax=Rangifer tarandus platyrhynchus TaxID=3082113 RepID=A0ABN8ZL67_RANTA|nr:unnamed protein product [Rangifer tarandus platyrhynchus]